MQEICLDLEFYPRMMGAISTNAGAVSHTKVDGSMANDDVDFAPPASTAEEFRRKFMNIRKRILLSAG